MLKSLVATALIAAFALPALALEPGGTISGMIAGHEVEAAVWVGQSDYDDYGTGGIGGSIALMVDALAPDLGLGTAAIEFTNYDFTKMPYENLMVIAVSKTEKSIAYYAELEAGLIWTPEEMRFDGEMMVVSGTLEGTLTRGPLYSHERDPSVTMPMSLRVEAVVPRIE